jgi:soluble lytic murein transglycosylase
MLLLASPQAAISHSRPDPIKTPATHLLSEADTALYKKAFAAAKKRQWKKAKRLAAGAADRRLAMVIRWLWLKSPGSRASFTQISDFLETNPEWPGRTELLRRAEAAMTEEMPDSRVLEWFTTRAPISKEGHIRYAKALLSAGRRTAAISELRQAWIEGTFVRAQERAFLKTFGSVLDEEDHRARLDRLLWDGARYEAKRMMRRVGRDHRAMAEARLRLRRLAGGVDWAISQVPDRLISDPGLMYERLRWRRRKGMDNAALEILRNPPAELVRPARWWRERKTLVRRLLRLGYISEAYRIARNHGQTEGKGLLEGEWLSGWIALRFLEDNAVAYRHFRTLYQAAHTPVSIARGAYWAGRAAEAMETPDEARLWYARAAHHVTTYYGQLAIERLGDHGDLRLPPEPEPDPPAASRFKQREVVEIVRQLAELGEDHLVKRFILRLNAIAETPEEHVLIASLSLFLGRPDLAILASKQARRAGTELPLHGYPLVALPDTKGPEKALLLSLSRQESSFNPKAVSRAGARGMMQILPTTARKVARQLRVRYSKRRLTSDPRYNVRLGSAYLSRLLNGFDGSYVLALAAYNAGPSRVRRWILDYGDPRDPGVDLVDWIESIPFPESRNYVQRVLEGLAVYRERLRGPALASAAPSPR